MTRNGAAVAVRAADQENEWPFPGFARQLLGSQAGETRNMSHTFAPDFPDPAMAGETVQLEAQVKTVRAVTLPEVDDEFARSVGQFESLDGLKEALTKDIEERTRADYDDEYFTRLIDKIKEGATIKYAPQTLAHEAEHVVDDLRQRLAQQGLDLETYYKMRKTDAAKFLEEEARPVAARRLERSLILDEIARRESIAVDDSSLDQEFTETLTSLQRQGVDLARVRGGKQGQQQLAQAVAMESAGRLLTRRTLERLKSIATGEAGEPGAADQPAEKSSAAARKKSGKGPGAKSAGKAGPSSASKNPKVTAKKSAGKKEKREKK